MILYGLGNFFFDQMWSQATREGLIPRHTIYDGRHLSTKLMTTVHRRQLSRRIVCHLFHGERLPLPSRLA